MDIENFFEREQKNNRYDARLDFLTKKGWDTTHIKKGVDSVINHFDDGAKSLVVYGEPQSGKTEVMIALTCALLDQEVQTVFVVMNDNVELEMQNFRRFKNATQLNPTPMRATEFIDLKNQDKKIDTQRVIFCRKNANNLENLIVEGRFLKDRVIIDDEADYASPDSKINKKGKQSAINRLVGKLGKIGTNGRYIGVTATPGRLDLNNTFLNRSEHWVFLDSHENYKGRAFFFPITKADKESSDYILERQPENGDSPKFLEECFLRFVTKVAILNLQCGDEERHENYSMLIHTAGEKFAHQKDKEDLEGFLYNFTAKKMKKLQKYFNYIKSYAEALRLKFNHGVEAESIFTYIIDNIGRRSVLVINSNNDRDNVDASCNPRDLFTFAIGGNIVSRGLTFNNLISFFFSRGVKGKLTQNTYVQRARMFGTRPYAEWFELCIPDSLYEDWASCFADHEMSIQSAIAGDIMHFSSARTRSADPSSIDEKNVHGSSGEIAPGIIFDIDEDLLNAFRFIVNKPISGIRRLIDSGQLTPDAFPLRVLDYIDEVAEHSDEGSALVEVADTFLYKGRNLDSETLTRRTDRGAIIASTIKGRGQYLEKSHLFMITGNDKGQARILYKLNAGRRILKNLISKKDI